MKNKKIAAIVLLVLILAGAGYAYWVYSNRPAPEAVEVVDEDTVTDSSQRGAIIYAPGNSYRLIAPEGWVIDTKSGKKDNFFPAVFYQLGDTWDGSGASVYTMPIPKNGRTYQEVVDSNIAWYKQQFPKLNHTPWAEVKTADGAKPTILLYEGDPEVNMELVAYVDAPNDVNAIILTANDESFFADAAPVFEQIVNSYSFITTDVEVRKKDEGAE